MRALLPKLRRLEWCLGRDHISFEESYVSWSGACTSLAISAGTECGSNTRKALSVFETLMGARLEPYDGERERILVWLTPR